MMEQANTEVLKQPRGFIRCLQLVFAVVAFSTLANYSTTIAISVVCKEGVAYPGEEFNEFIRKVTYPFRVNQLKPVNLTGLCKITKADDIKFIGDFSSDAQFFVFTGVMCFLFSILSCYSIS